MVNIHEHSIDLSLIKGKLNILDAGCRGFGFTNYFRELGHNVIAIDIEELEGDYLKIGIGLNDGFAGITKDTDLQARRLTSGNEVQVYSLKTLENMFGKFDIIKLDIEGEELSLLKSWNHPVCEQLSVEFHAHTGRQTKEELDILLKELSIYYTITAKWESQHSAGYNYWDVLMIKK